MLESVFTIDVEFMGGCFDLLTDFASFEIDSGSDPINNEIEENAASRADIAPPTNRESSTMFESEIEFAK